MGEVDEVTIKLELTVPEINTVLRSLGKHPFEEIASLIQKVKMQGDAQLAEIAATETQAD